MHILIQRYWSLSVFCKNECHFYRKNYPVRAPYFQILSSLNDILCIFLEKKREITHEKYKKNPKTGKKVFTMKGVYEVEHPVSQIIWTFP